MWATTAGAGRVQIVGMLLVAGANPSRGVGEASGAGRAEVVRMLLEAGGDPSLGLASASMAGRIEIVKILLRAGGDPNDSRWTYRQRLSLTALHAAALRGLVGIARVLVEAGADIAARTRYRPPGLLEVFVSAFASGFFHGLIDIEDILNVDLADMDGWTPVQFAAAAGHSEVVDCLKAAWSLSGVK
ncbi:MAG: ankyrin repeat domain-containing protein [Rhodospirillaceae bacterium]|nr:ankyrin repeat domain-containing protein [Rhodospirillaceae bacterium]